KAALPCQMVKNENYSSVILCNNTLFGPFYPLSEMFAEMEKKELDFWGITAFAGDPGDPFGTIKYGYIPEHVQSFFMVFEKRFLETDDFKSFWENLPEIHRYEEAIGYFEAIFTKEMADKGYRWDVYMACPELRGFTKDPLRDFPRYLIERKRCPVMKKRSFFHEYGEAFERSGGEATREAFEYLEGGTDYDTDLIWETILRTENMAAIKKRMHLNFILPEGLRRKGGIATAGTVSRENSAQKDRPRGTNILPSLAAIAHIYYPELAVNLAAYASNLPDGADIYISVSGREAREAAERAFASLKDGHRVEIRMTGNRGRDLMPFLTLWRDVIFQYDVILKVHDKKVPQLAMLSTGRSWERMCFECLMPSREFVWNVLDLFERNARLGMLTPPPPVHAEYYPTIGHGEWGANYKETARLAKELGIRVPVEREWEPVAPFGSECYLRTDALRTLFSKAWDLKDFPEEPLAADATVLHAIERVIPFAVQNDGYYSGWVMSDKWAPIILDNLTYLTHTLRERESRLIGGYMPYRVFMDRVGHLP
ncbi:MAG: rhamnan synthesis F family protein, partial [Lachnospiraceae bacterium]|nr:rhamnan synthesis F family protein [Lachnospiraceae bacterium]